MHKSGFTLIELSIVLVIIGLLTGSVLVGGDLIKSARNRSVFREAEQYQQAFAAFKGKYGQLPGDMVNPGEFFPNQTGGNSGNGNGLIYWSSEGPAAWLQLASAGMIPKGKLVADCTSDGNLATYGTDENNNSITTCLGWPGLTIPASSAISDSGWSILTYRSNNSLMLGTVSQNRNLAKGPVLSATDMFSIDKKFDDGLPLSGSIRVLLGNIRQSNGCAAMTSNSSQYLIPSNGIAAPYASQIRCTPIFKLGL